MYADDLCFVAETPDGLQQLIYDFYHTCLKFGLKISVKKTEVMSMDSHGRETLAINLGEDLLMQTDKFCYLGSTITTKCDLDAEISRRICAAAAAFGKLDPKVMLGGAVGEVSPGGEDLHLTVTVVRDEHGYGMKVSGDNPVYVQSVKEHGAAWRAGLRAGDRILKVDSVPVQFHTHQQVVHMIRANPSTTLTVLQNSSRHKTPITGPVPVNQEKLRQLEMAKVHTMRLMLDKEQKYMRDLKNELLKVPDVRKQVELESAEQRCSLLQHEIDNIMATQPEAVTPTTPTTPKLSRKDPEKNANMGFLSGLPRSLSNLTGQSLRNLRQNRQKQETPLVRQNSDETNNKRQVFVPRTNRVPTTCLDNTPPPLPPRSTERPKRNPISPMSPPSPMSSMNSGSPVNPLAKPTPSMQNKIYKINPMHQSMPEDKFRRSSNSLDGEVDGPQPNSIALQMSYPLVNVPPPPLQTDNRGGVPVLHVRSQSSPEHLDHDLPRTSASGLPAAADKEAWSRGTPPPGTPPPPYLQAHAQQPCADPQRAIISMEEDDPPSDNSTSSGLFSNLRSVRESKARMAVLINWLLGERRSACASLVLVLTDAYRAAAGVAPHTRRRWAYELHSTFLVPDAVLPLNGVDENMANEIDHVLVNEHEKEEVLRNVFRKARRAAKEELARQLADFRLKRRLGLAALYAPDDRVLRRCDVDRAQMDKRTHVRMSIPKSVVCPAQEQVVVEQLLCARLGALAAGGHHAPHDAQHALLAALAAAALALDCRLVRLEQLQRTSRAAAAAGQCHKRLELLEQNALGPVYIIR
ncbi:unnamed protein product, partial [Brenthis ino]